MTTTLNNVEIGEGVNKLNIKNSMLNDQLTKIDAYEIITDAASGLRIGAGTSVDSNPEWINDFMIAFERNQGNNNDIIIKNDSSTIEIKPNAITFAANYFNFNTPTTGSIVLRGISAYTGYTQLTNNVEFNEEATAKKNLQVDQNLTVGKSETSGNQDVDLYADVFVRGDLSLNGNLNLPNNSIKPEYIDADLGADYTVDICMNNTLTVGGDVSFHNNLNVNGSTTVNGIVSLNNATVMRGNVYAAKDLHVYGNLKVDHIENQSTYNISQTNYQVVTVDELSLNGRMFINDDASFNKDVYVKEDLKVDGNLIIGNNTIPSAAIDGTVGADYTIDICMNKTLTVGGDASFNGDIIVDGNINGVSNTKMGYLSTITSNVQTQLNDATTERQLLTNNKQDKITSSSKLSAELIGNGLVTNSNFNALEGVTSNIQTQLDNIAPNYDVDIHMTKTLTVDGDTTIKGNLKADQITNEYIINTSTTNYSLIIAEDLSLNGRLLIQDDASFNKDVYVKENLLVDGNINGVSKTELGYLSGVTSDIQTQITANTNATTGFTSQIAGKQDKIDSSNRLSATNIGANGDVTNEKFGYLAGVTSDIQTQLTTNANATSGFSSQIAGKQDKIDSSNRLSATNIGANGLVTDTNFGYLAGATGNLQNQIDINTNSITNNASQIANKQTLINENNRLSATNIGANGDVTNENFGYLAGVTSNIQTQLTGKQDTIDSSNRLSATNIGANGLVTDTNFGYLAGATGNLQNQINLNTNSITNNTSQIVNKQDVINAGNRLSATNIGANGNVTNEKFGYLAGVTSDIQTQLNNIASDYTIDICMNKTLTVGGDVSFNGNLIVDNDVTINGNLKADKITNDYILNTTTTNYTLMVAEDLSLNGKLLVLEDASLNSNLSVSGTINNITNDEISYLSGVTSNIQTQLNNVAADYTIDICMNKTLTVGGDVSFNSDLIISGNLTVDADKVPTWNQDTTGNAATATTASNVPYSGLTGTVPTWNQDTTGNAATATTATTANNVPYSGLTGTVPTWNQDTTGTASTVTNPTQSAITSVGTLQSLSLSGDITSDGYIHQF